MIRHAEDRAGAELKSAFVDHTENTCQPFVRRSSFLDLKWAGLTVDLENHIELLGVSVAVEVQIRFQAGGLVALNDIRYSKVFEQRAIHGSALSHFRERPSVQIADEACVIEVHLQCLDRALQHIVGIGMQQENDAERFQNIDPCFCSRHVDVCILASAL